MIRHTAHTAQRESRDGSDSENDGVFVMVRGRVLSRDHGIRARMGETETAKLLTPEDRMIGHQPIM